MSNLHRFARTLLAGYVLLLIAAAIAGVWLLKVNHMRVLSVQTDSMSPVFRAGDALVVRPVSEFHVGEVVTYTAPDGQLISHRIVSIDTKLGELTTRGDNAAKADTPIIAAKAAGKVTAVLPKAGSVLGFLRKPIGLTIFVYLPALGILAGEIWTLSRHYRRGYYRLLTFR